MPGAWTLPNSLLSSRTFSHFLVNTNVNVVLGLFPISFNALMIYIYIRWWAPISFLILQTVYFKNTDHDQTSQTYYKYRGVRHDNFLIMSISLPLLITSLSTHRKSSCLYRLLTRTARRRIPVPEQLMNRSAIQLACPCWNP